MRRSPQSAPPVPVAVLVSAMPPPPQAVRPRPTTAARATRWVRRSRRAIAFFSFLTFRDRRGGNPGCNLGGAGSAAVARRRISGDPVEHHAQRRDGDAGGQALAEQLVLREPRDH